MSDKPTETEIRVESMETLASQVTALQASGQPEAAITTEQSARMTKEEGVVAIHAGKLDSYMSLQVDAAMRGIQFNAFAPMVMNLTVAFPEEGKVTIEEGKIVAVGVSADNIYDGICKMIGHLAQRLAETEMNNAALQARIAMLELRADSVTL